MQKELITEKHIKWLKDNLCLTFEEIEQKQRAVEEIATNLALAEADAIDTDDEDTASEVIDIVFGPYDK